MAKDTSKEKAAKGMVLISAASLKSLLSESDKYKEKIDGLVGELREEIGNAVEKKHLDKDAFALVKKFRRIKSNERKHVLFHTFIAYLEMSGEQKLIDSVTELPLDGEKEEGEGDAPSGKVVPLKAAE